MKKYRILLTSVLVFFIIGTLNVGAVTNNDKYLGITAMKTAVGKLSKGMTIEEIEQHIGKQYTNTGFGRFRPFYLYAGGESLTLDFDYHGGLYSAQNNDGFDLLSEEYYALKADFPVFINEKEMLTSNPIVTINDRTYIPIKEFEEALGIKVAPDNNDTYIIDSDKTAAENELLSDEWVAKIALFDIQVNGVMVKTSNPITIINDEIYMPLRELCEILEMDINWIDESRRVEISDNSGNADVVINKVDYSVLSEDEQIMGKFFYEKPQIPDKYVGAEKINTYFKKDCNNFFNGEAMFFGEDSFSLMKDLLKDSVERWGEEGITKQPFCYYATTKMTFLSEEYISFCQTYVWAAEGPREVWNQGLTFSLKTGERVPFTEFYDVDANELKTNLCNVLLPLFSDSSEIQAEITQMYSSNNSDTFSVVYYDKVLDLDKNYFYDGQSINLTLNYGVFPHKGLIFKWRNGELSSGTVYAYLLNEVGDLSQHVY